jgi:hypothetical protein
MKSAPRQLLAALACALGLHAAAADAQDAAGQAFVARFRAALAQADAGALADLSALPFLYEGRGLGREAFARDAAPALFTPSVRRRLQHAPAQREGDRLLLWCKPYGFYLGPLRGQWRLIEFVADVD